jgi:cell division protein FtsL
MTGGEHIVHMNNTLKHITSKSVKLSSVSKIIYVYIHVYVYIYIHIYIYMYVGSVEHDRWGA